jgi:hypothetical protein
MSLFSRLASKVQSIKNTVTNHIPSENPSPSLTSLPKEPIFSSTQINYTLSSRPSFLSLFSPSLQAIATQLNLSFPTDSPLKEIENNLQKLQEVEQDALVQILKNVQ